MSASDLGSGEKLNVVKLTQEEQRVQNLLKYGDKDHDVISDAYRISKEVGDSYCCLNAIKYLRRYISKSKKAGNKQDLLKIIDYVNRAMEKSDVQHDVVETV